MSIAAHQTLEEKEFSGVMDWLKSLSTGDEKFKLDIVRFIHEVQAWLREERNVYTICRSFPTFCSYVTTITTLYKACQFDKELRKWVEKFDPENTTLEEYSLFHGSVSVYMRHRNNVLIFH